MNTKMYVGHLPMQVTELELRELFGNHGQVDDVALTIDHEKGNPRGFAFVTMSSRSEMASAIEALHGMDFKGSILVVNEAGERDEATTAW